MLDQILTQAVSNIQLVTAVLLLTVALLQLVHIGQTSRINKKLSRAGRWLQRYLNAVFSEETDAEPAEEQIQAGQEITVTAGDKEMQLEAAAARSRQEENMRVSLAHKKLKKDEEILDTVLQEIFD